MSATAVECAEKILTVVPEVMQVVRTELRRERARELSIVQFRSLAFLKNHPGSTLSAVADHVGLTLSSMSTQVSKLVHRKLVQRTEAPQDRRYVTLQLTPAGHTAVESAFHGAHTNLTARCEGLTPEECKTLLQALEILRTLFSNTPDAASTNPSLPTLTLQTE